MALDTANLAGLSQTGAPVTMRGSMTRPITAAARAAIISKPAAVSGALPFQSVCTTTNLLVDVIAVNMTLPGRVDSVNIKTYDARRRVRTTEQRPKKKWAGQYLQGDLRRALVEEAVRTIQLDGIEHLTLRAAGEQLGVSRTALYRHFSDKQALLAAVGREGFRMLRVALTAAWEDRGRGQAGFEAMGLAYVQFAVAHPAHYRVMFGRFVESCSKDVEFIEEAGAAFQVLVDSLVEQQ